MYISIIGRRGDHTAGTSIGSPNPAVEYTPKNDPVNTCHPGKYACNHRFSTSAIYIGCPLPVAYPSEYLDGSALIYSFTVPVSGISA